MAGEGDPEKAGNPVSFRRAADDGGKTKSWRRRRLVDRRTRGERRIGLERLLDPAGRSAEDIRRDASEWSDELDRRHAADRRSGSDQRSGADRRQRPDRRKT